MRTSNAYRDDYRKRRPYTSPRMIRALQKEQVQFTQGERPSVEDALASGELLTAHQAALAVGVNVSTFNYHMRKGHIPHLPTPGGVRFVYMTDARLFARRLELYRMARHSLMEVEVSAEAEAEAEAEADRQQQETEHDHLAAAAGA